MEKIKTNKNRWLDSLEKLIETNVNISVIFMYNLICTIVALVFYYLIPIILNYPPNFREILENLGAIPYPIQFSIILGTVLIVSDILLLWWLSGLNNWKESCQKECDAINERIKIVREKCVKLPYAIYYYEISIVVVIASLTLIIFTARNNTSFLFIVKIAILLFSFMSFTGIVSLIFTKKVLTQILLHTYNGEGLQGMRLGLRKKIHLQMIPILLVAVLFTSLVGYSRLVEEKGILLYKIYKNQLEHEFIDLDEINGINDISSRLNRIRKENDNDSTFIIDPEGKITTSDGKDLDKIFLINVNKFSSKYGGYVYADIGEVRGVSIKLKSNGGEWIAGIKFAIVTSQTVLIYVFTLIVLMLLCILILNYLTKSMAEDISLVANSLMEIADNEDVVLDKKIPVTSNDEIGDLVVAFNKIQEKHKEYVQKLKDSQEIMIQQDRLASLGQMIGGIAHNLKTPIMSISGGIEALKDLIREYDESIEDGSVTFGDHHEIAAEMREWIDRMKSYLSYMSDVISAVKGQAVKLNESSQYSFTIRELTDRIKILMKYELKRNGCSMDMDIQLDPEEELKGEINNLVQVLNNLISNAIDAYEGKGGKIDLGIYRNGQKIEFVVKDYGKGIPNDVKNKLFKEMLTTKGKRGTGLGLYMSYSAIRAKFSGNMWIESEEGKGAAFYVSIPYL